MSSVFSVIHAINPNVPPTWHRQFGLALQERAPLLSRASITGRSIANMSGRRIACDTLQVSGVYEERVGAPDRQGRSLVEGHQLLSDERLEAGVE